MASKKPKPNGAGLQAALDHITKQFGEGTVMRLGDGHVHVAGVIDTGSVGLNHALGIGGLPRGRVIEVFGPEGTGKTTLALHCAASCQKQGGTVAFIDAEHAMDPTYAAAVGVDVDALLINQPDSGEQGLEVADMLLRSGEVDLIIVDSVAALVPQAEIDGLMGDSHVGLQARLMGQALRKMTSAMSSTSATVIFINQLREKVGVLFGSPETTPGGRGLPFYSSVRLDVRRIETLKNGTEAIGSRLRVKVVKNKVSPPFRVAEFDLRFGHGIDRTAEVLDHAVGAGIVLKSGAYYSVSNGTDTKPMGQGKAAACAWLDEHPEALEALSGLVVQALASGHGVAAPPPPPPITSGKAPVT